MQERATEQLEPAELVGLVARSAEGTAAKGMAIKGHEDLWVDIQANTFRNWVNEHLKHSERGRELGPVLDLADDFCDGTRLCALVETLTGKRLARWNPRPVNQHHYLENVSTALKAVEADGVKLVNIGRWCCPMGRPERMRGCRCNREGACRKSLFPHCPRERAREEEAFVIPAYVR